MQKDDKELEKYLSEFHPRAVRPLEISRPAAKAWLRRLAAAAVILLSVGGGLWYSRHAANTLPAPVMMQPVRIDFRVQVVSPNTISLTKLALEDPKQFDAQLEAESRTVLPTFQGQQSTLQAFAKH